MIGLLFYGRKLFIHTVRYRLYAMKRYRMKSDLEVLIYFVFLCAFQCFYSCISIKNRMQDLVTITKLSIILLATSCEIIQIEITRYRKDTMKIILISFINYFCLQFILLPSFIFYLKQNTSSKDKCEILTNRFNNSTQSNQR